MLNALSIDVEDYFQVQGFESVVGQSQWEQYPSHVVKNTQQVLRLLDECGVRGTFFILGWIAERYPHLVRDIAADGHEIATHGHSHQLVYSQTREEFAADVGRSLRAIGNACPDVRILGYRAPSFSITAKSLWALDVLADLGIQYDSSIFPLAAHDRYGIPDAPRFANRVRPQLYEFPVSTVRLLGRNLPVAGGGYFRLFPLWLTRMAIRRIHAEGHPALVYLHPWEFDPDQPRIPGASASSRFRHHVNIAKTAGRLRRLLDRFRFAPMREVFAEQLEEARGVAAPR